MEQQPQKGFPMDPDDFESEFAKFWDSQACNDLNWVLFDLIKAAFAAGCRAAGAQPPEYRRTVKLDWKAEEPPQGEER